MSSQDFDIDYDAVDRDRRAFAAMVAAHEQRLGRQLTPDDLAYLRREFAVLSDATLDALAGQQPIQDEHGAFPPRLKTREYILGIAAFLFAGGAVATAHLVNGNYLTGGGTLLATVVIIGLLIFHWIRSSEGNQRHGR